MEIMIKVFLLFYIINWAKVVIKIMYYDSLNNFKII